jgi:hypothetical protein
MIPTDPNGQQVPDLFEFMLERYKERALGEAGQEAQPSGADELFAMFGNSPQAQQVAAATINHFIEFARNYLLENPPQTHIMLAEGFGVTLAGGHNVSLLPATDSQQPGAMEPGFDVAVTPGMTRRGQGGVVPTEAYGVTGPPQGQPPGFGTY